VIDHVVRSVTGDDVKSNNGLLEERELSLQAKYTNVYFYIQPDIKFASRRANNFPATRCLFRFVIKKEFRKSRKVKFLLALKICNQVKQIDLDRNDALNSAVANERDLGAFY
jgi:hypothetical protein